jgi:5-methylcytosine-specific restriction endonuclease McrA
MKRKFSKHIFWSEEEELLLSHIYPAGMPWDEMLVKLVGRHRRQIQGKASLLGLKRPTVQKMSDDERLKRKREGMQNLRDRDPEMARRKRNEFHSNNREMQTAKMRKYAYRRFFWSKAMKLRGNDRATTQQIASLWRKQRGLCAITGRRLDRGAQLDHKLPKARNGGDGIENMQWVCEDANIAKRHMTDAEFVVLCADVMHWIGSRIQLIEDAIK